MTNAYNPGSRFRLSSSYDKRIDPMTGIAGKFHSGQDFAARAGTPIPAAASGKVVYSGYNKNLGNVVIVKNDAGGYSLYGHMQAGDRVELGRRIWQRDTIGLVGSTGARTTDNHLHYSVITEEAGENITGTSEDGSIGIPLNRKNTIDPAGHDNYDPTPRYLDETRRAAQLMSGTDANTTSGGLYPDRQDSFGDRFGKWGSSPRERRPTSCVRSSRFVRQPLWKMGLCPSSRLRR
jgi:Peptidase family M23